MMETIDKSESKSTTFTCVNCGAKLKYEPGTAHLKCEYCGVENEIEHDNASIEELDLYKALSEKAYESEKLQEVFVKCDTCGATSSLEPDVTASNCPYCSSPLVLKNAEKQGIIQPKSILPFKVKKDEAKNHFKKWINKLWFAPGDLRKAALTFDQFKGVYIPYWTFDADTYSEYKGQRGDYYYVTESYTTTENGKSVTKQREVRKTSWSWVSGQVRKFFDDIIVVATRSVPQKYINKLEPWDLENLVPFNSEYLSGFITEKYQIELEEGFEIAKQIADEEIRSLVKKDIGGDEQRINSLNTYYDNITFKHLLLPVFVCAYSFKGKLYQFLVNGRTGEVQGKRPYSWMKITLSIIAGLAIVGGIILLVTYFKDK